MKHVTTKHNGISIIESYKNTFEKRYASISGRANRNEYSAFLLVYSICSLLVCIVCVFVSMWAIKYDKDILSHDIDGIAQMRKRINLGMRCLLLLKLLHVIPLICLLVRRSHDLDTSGWWVVGACMLWMISRPLFNILLAVMALLPGTLGPNQYGLPPAKKDELTLSNYLLFVVFFFVRPW